MTHSALSRWLKEHHAIQFWLGILPAILIAVYSAFYLNDMLNIASVLAVNDELTKSAIENDMLLSVEELSTDKARVVPSKGTEENFNYGDLVCRVDTYFQGYEILVLDEKVYTSRCDLESYPTDVYLLENGFRLESNGESKEVDSLGFIKVIAKMNKGCRLRVDGGFFVDQDIDTLNYCTILEDYGVYYNQENGCFIRNVQEDFDKMFLTQSKIYYVLMASTCLIMLLIFIWQSAELKDKTSKYYFILNIVMVVMLVGIIGLTYLLL